MQLPTVIGNKAFYRGLPTIKGYIWGGYLPESDLHVFVSGNYHTGFRECLVKSSDIADQSYLYMMEHDLTRTEG